MRSWWKLLVGFGLAAVLGLAAAACGSDAEAVIDPGDEGNYTVTLTSADFAEGIDNPWLPWTVGSRWVYEGREDDEVERIEVVVLEETRNVNGVAATVVRDTVTINGELIEDTYDWYAQDADGNVWYLGEDSAEYEDGEIVTTAGSWEWGVDGALPGIIMYADPQVGQAYRQEYYEGEAEDLAEIVAVGESITVPAGTYDNVIIVSEWNPLEPDVVEEKLVASGVGVVLERKVEGGSETVELLEFTPS